MFHSELQKTDLSFLEALSITCSPDWLSNEHDLLFFQTNGRLQAGNKQMAGVKMSKYTWMKTELTDCFDFEDYFRTFS